MLAGPFGKPECGARVFVRGYLRTVFRGNFLRCTFRQTRRRRCHASDCNCLCLLRLPIKNSCRFKKIFNLTPATGSSSNLDKQTRPTRVFSNLQRGSKCSQKSPQLRPSR
ncbi:hypothetical protein OA90_21965 [Labrenzia sp. OB1]|nr:hypothetical protein OA90_21965 [Labrenzia sp. OB1]